MGSISIREHIKWGSEALSEPTSTIVLTSPRRYFVDIRILKTALEQQPRVDGTGDTTRDGFPIDQLDWAIGGTSVSETITRDGGEQVAHSTFHHWVDSRTTEPERATDEGDMFPGKETGTTLETGTMVNPATGTETSYEELWRDEDPQPVAGQAKFSVFRLHDDDAQKRGLFVQLGQHAQGVLRVGDSFTAERWQWDSSLSKWNRALKVGDERTQSLERLLAEVGNKHHENDTFETASGVWAVIETS